MGMPDRKAAVTSKAKPATPVERATVTIAKTTSHDFAGASVR
jgi:hypothetical protein